MKPIKSSIRFIKVLLGTSYTTLCQSRFQELLILFDEVSESYLSDDAPFATVQPFLQALAEFMIQVSEQSCKVLWKAMMNQDIVMLFHRDLLVSDILSEYFRQLLRCLCKDVLATVGLMTWKALA